MSFLKRFFKNAPLDGAPTTKSLPSSFEALSEEDLEAHMEIIQYGSFQLTDAVRPSYDLRVIPRQGYRHDVYHDEETKANVPVLMAAASSDILFELFMDLLEPLGGEVDVVLETSHNRDSGGHVDLYREHIDMPVLKSTLYDFEEPLLNDGCTGIAILNPGTPQEVQFDEHKMLIIYGEPLAPFEAVLRAHNVICQDQMRFITEAEHVHSSSEDYYRRFDELRLRLGMDATIGCDPSFG